MKAKGFTLVETLVSLLISITVLGAGVQGTRSTQRSTQFINDQLVMSGLADEVVANLQVLRYSSATNPPTWSPLKSIVSGPGQSFPVSGLAVSDNNPSKVSSCSSSCAPASAGGPLVLSWAESKNGKYKNKFIYTSDTIPVCTSWMAVSCDNSSYGTHQDTIEIARQQVGNFSGGEVIGLSSIFSGSAQPQTDALDGTVQKTFYDLDVTISTGPPVGSGTSLYSVNVTLVNHADPTISYSKTQLLADLP